jgi:cell wall-associated NlpC family hydrolase
VFARLGIDLPHSSAQLARLGEPVARDTAEMRPGDLLVFSKPKSKRISHVGIYVGDGMMVHASSTSKQVVETPVVEYRGLTLRSVRRVFAVDSTGRGGGH